VVNIKGNPGCVVIDMDGHISFDGMSLSVGWYVWFKLDILRFWITFVVQIGYIDNHILYIVLWHLDCFHANLFLEFIIGTEASTLGNGPQWPNTHQCTIHWCLLLLSCGWTSTESIFGFTSVTTFVKNRSEI
jgi:hypothetical protein